MSALNQDFETFAGDAANILFTVAGVNISSVSDILWSAQRALTSAPALSKSKAAGGITFVTDGSDGKFQVALTGADTSSLSGFYLHEAVLVDATGLKTTVATGRMQVGRLPAWTYDPGTLATTPVYQIRFLLGDTDGADPQMYDEEINWAYTLRGNTWGATSMCALALAAKYSRLTSISADGVSQALQQKADAFEKIAVFYAKKEAIYRAVPFLGGVSIADMRATLAQADRVPDIFRIGLNDNPPTDGVNPVNSPPIGSDNPIFDGGL